MLDDLFHIVDLAGVLLNKKAPSDEDTRPYEEFMKYADNQLVTDKDGNDGHYVQTVKTEHVPKILMGIFIGQEDEKRIDAAALIEKFAEQGDNKMIVEHVVD